MKYLLIPVSNKAQNIPIKIGFKILTKYIEENEHNTETTNQVNLEDFIEIMQEEDCIARLMTHLGYKHEIGEELKILGNYIDEQNDIKAYLTNQVNMMKKSNSSN